MFGVTAGKLLGFFITMRGIEVDTAKLKAILKIKPSKIEKEVRSFLDESSSYVSYPN